MALEQWKKLKDFDGIEISSNGALRTKGSRRGHVLEEQRYAERPFYQFHINRRHYTFLTERLVAETFVPNPQGLPCVCHKDRDLFNNKADNLYWGRAIDKIISLPNEEWRDLNGYEGLYMVSNKGRIATLERIARHRLMSSNILKPCINPNGYYLVALSKKGVSKSYLLHRLIAQTFIDNPENKPMVDHIDTDKLNNCVENLQWCTCEENMSNPKTIQKMNSHGGAKSKRSIPIIRVSLKDGSIKTYGCIKEALKDNRINHT